LLALRLSNFSTYARQLLKLTVEKSDQKASVEMIPTWLIYHPDRQEISYYRASNRPAASQSNDESN